MSENLVSHVSRSREVVPNFPPRISCTQQIEGPAQLTHVPLTASLCAFVSARPLCSPTTISAQNMPHGRGEFIKNAAGVAAVFGVIAGVAPAALAEVDNPIVPFLGGGDKIDVNNANVRAYIKLPGM